MCTLPQNPQKWKQENVCLWVEQKEEEKKMDTEEMTMEVNKKKEEKEMEEKEMDDWVVEEAASGREEVKWKGD